MVLCMRSRGVVMTPHCVDMTSRGVVMTSRGVEMTSRGSVYEITSSHGLDLALQLKILREQREGISMNRVQDLVHSATRITK